MAGFSEATLQKKLLELSNTLPSIQTLSLWLIHHRKHSKTIADLWLREMRREREPKKHLTLIYLANDVLQNARRRWPQFRDHFQTSLINGLAHAARNVDAKTLQSIRRVLDVWRERSVYEDDFLTRLTYSFTSNLSKEMLALFNEGAAKTPPRDGQEPSRSRSSSTSKSTKQTASTSSTSSTTTTFSKPKSTYMCAFESPLTAELPANFLRTPDDEESNNDDGQGGETKKTDDVGDVAIDAAATTQLMDSLKELEKAPSTDVRTRAQIAQFPPDVADLSKLKSIQNKEDADRFALMVAQADNMLSEYNARLNEELEKRRTTLANFERFVAAHKRRLEDETRELSTWKEKVSKLSTDRQDVLMHIQALPDLSKLPDPTKLGPLPSAGDLFMN